jgi:hypothetical protein
MVEGKIEGWIEVMGRQGRRRKHLDDLNETRKYRKLKKEPLDHARFGTGYESVVRQTTK